jgi:hypothetical protein
MPLLSGFAFAGPAMPPPAASGGTEVTLTNPDGDGKNYKKHTFTAATTTWTVTRPGWVKALVVGRGATGYSGNRGSGGRVWEGWLYVPAGTYTVTVPQGGTNLDGAGASIGSLASVAAVNTSPGAGTGAGAAAAGGATGWISTISGTSVEYARSVTTSANPGDGGPNAAAVVAGIVIVRYQV